VTHIDDKAIEALTKYYSESIKPGSDILVRRTQPPEAGVAARAHPLASTMTSEGRKRGHSIVRHSRYNYFAEM